MPRPQTTQHLAFWALLAALSLSPARAAELNPQPSPDDQPQFASVIDDLPLMPGLKVSQDKDVLFVAPKAGRIAETEAAGEVDIDQVYDFYKSSLPHLGWHLVDGRTYEREGELLRIDAHADGKLTTVRFTVKPKTK